MDLKTFVKQTLLQIIEGVSAAQERATDLKASVNPAQQSGHARLQEVKFEVQVSANDVDETKGGMGIFVGSVGIGVQGKTQEESSSAGKISFAVGVQLPTQGTYYGM